MELIYKDTARRIIDSPRTKEQMLRMLEATPPARPERKTGTYTESKENDEWYCWYATCNECGREWMGSRNFCPNCGVDMRGEQDG